MRLKSSLSSFASAERQCQLTGRTERDHRCVVSLGPGVDKRGLAAGVPDSELVSGKSSASLVLCVMSEEGEEAGVSQA